MEYSKETLIKLGLITLNPENKKLNEKIKFDLFFSLQQSSNMFLHTEMHNMFKLYAKWPIPMQNVHTKNSQ